MPNKELSYVNYNGDTYEINAVKVNGHTIQSDVPADVNWNGTEVELSNVNNSGNDIATISIDGTETTLKAPAYTGTSPISVNSGTLAISHANSGVSANTYGTISNANISPGHNGTFTVPAFTVNATGHITEAGAHTVKMPEVEVSAILTSGTKIATITLDGTETDLYAQTNTNTTYSLSKDGNVLKLTPSQGNADEVTLNLASTATDGLMSSGDKTKLNGVSTNANKTEVTRDLTSGTKVAVISIDGTETQLYAPTNTNTTYTLSKSGDNLTLTPSSGDVQTVTLNTVSSTANGLMLSADKTKLDTVSSGANKTEVTQGSLTSGTLVGTISIDGTDTELYAPSNSDTWIQYVGATATKAGTAGYIPGAAANQLYQYFAGNGTWRGEPAAAGELGLYSYTDKAKLAGISTGAKRVEFAQTKTSGKELGKISIDGTETAIYDDRDIWYATCPTGAGTAAKVVTTTNGDFRLETGATVFIKFTYANTSTSATLNIDGKGAKSIKAYGTTNPTASTWADGAVVRFTYDGTNFIQENAQIASTSVYGITKLSSAVNSDSNALAATASAVKSAYDLASSKSIVSYLATVTSGIELGEITINGDETKIYQKTFTGTAPISVDNTNYKIEHAASGPANTDTSKGDTSNQTPAFGGTFKALSATVDKYGHTTALAEHTIKVPELSNAPTYNSGVLIDTITINGDDSNIYIPAYPTIESLGLNKVLKFIGFSTTSISDGSSATPTISGMSSYTPAVGDVVIDNSVSGATTQYEYVYTSANKWERLGGDQLYAIAGEEYDVTNGGTNQNSAVTISPKTTQIYSMTSAGSVTSGSEASLTSSVTNEKLTYTWTTNVPTVVTLPGRSSVINAWTGYNTGVANTYAAAQTFTPTQKTITIN